MNQSIVISYLTLRKVVGLLGLAFPVILVVGSVVVGGCEEIQGSISGYYHTVMRDIFVGVLCIVAFFLFAYNGYESVDKIAGKLACFFALGVTFFPTGLDEPFTSCTIPPLPGSYLISKIHYAFAASLFLTLTYFSLFLFTKSSGNPTPEKLKRNIVYKVCGFIMLSCIILLAIYFLFFEHSAIREYKPVFFLEGIALWAFGFSWLIKGELLLKDE